MPLGVASAATGLTGIGAPLSLPLGAAGALFAAPDLLRRLTMPEEDESRGWAVAEGGLQALPVAGSALRGLRSLGQGAATAKNVMPTLDDVVRGADMFNDVAPRSGGMPARAVRSRTDIPRHMNEDGLFQANNATEPYTAPGFANRAASMGDATRRQNPGLGEAWDEMSDEAEKGWRTVRGMYSPEAMAAHPLKARAGAAVADDFVDLTDELDALPTDRTDMIRRIQERARAFREQSTPRSLQFPGERGMGQPRITMINDDLDVSDAGILPQLPTSWKPFAGKTPTARKRKR